VEDATLAVVPEAMSEPDVGLLELAVDDEVGPAISTDVMRTGAETGVNSLSSANDHATAIVGARAVKLSEYPVVMLFMTTAVMASFPPSRASHAPRGWRYDIPL